MKRNFIRPFTRLKFARRFIARRNKPKPDLWQLGLDVREVILQRTSRAMNGTLSADEARRMVLEKHSAAFRARFAYIQALMRDDPLSATRDFCDIYVTQPNP
jgi:hypothetical protein